MIVVLFSLDMCERCLVVRAVASFHEKITTEIMSTIKLSSSVIRVLAMTKMKTKLPQFVC